ncbi:hypothetical protein RCL1_000049 [Eukaryota sp. TZLM3-RCL]
MRLFILSLLILFITASTGPQCPFVDSLQYSFLHTTTPIISTYEVHTESVLDLPSPNNEPTSTQDVVLRKFNFASADFGAKIISYAPEKTKSPSAILLDNKDKYLIVPCSSQLILDIELVEEVLLSSLSLSSFEFYSGSPSVVHVMSTKQLSRDTAKLPFNLNSSIDAGWIDLGQHDVATRHATSSIKLEPVWAKSLRLVVAKWETHRHHLCTISHVKVLGLTPLEQLKLELITSLESQSTTTEELTLEPLKVGLLASKDLGKDDVIESSKVNNHDKSRLPSESGESYILSMNKKLSALESHVIKQSKMIDVCFNDLYSLNSTLSVVIDRESVLINRLRQLESTIFAQNQHISVLADELHGVLQIFEAKHSKNSSEYLIKSVVVVTIIALVFIILLYFSLKYSKYEFYPRSPSPSPHNENFERNFKVPLLHPGHFRSRSR